MDNIRPVIPDKTILNFQFAEPDMESLNSFFAEWEQKINNPNFDRDEFMVRFMATDVMTRYKQFLETNKDNTFIDVGLHDGAYQQMNTVPDPIYYYELETKFDKKTKYEFRQANPR